MGAWGYGPLDNDSAQDWLAGFPGSGAAMPKLYENLPEGKSITAEARRRARQGDYSKTAIDKALRGKHESTIRAAAWILQQDPKASKARLTRAIAALEHLLEEGNTLFWKNYGSYTSSVRRQISALKRKGGKSTKKTSKKRAKKARSVRRRPKKTGAKSKKKIKCRVCKKIIRQSSGPGRPRTVHKRCS